MMMMMMCRKNKCYKCVDTKTCLPVLLVSMYKKKTCYPSKTFEPYEIENVYLLHCVTPFWSMKSADNLKDDTS